MSLGEFWLERGNPEEAQKVFEAAIREVEPSYHNKVAQGPLGDVLRDLYDCLAESLKHQGQDQAAGESQQAAIAAFHRARHDNFLSQVLGELINLLQGIFQLRSG